VQANPPWLCGTITSPGQPQPLSGKGYLCPADQGQFCTSSVGDPSYGNVGFDNLGQTALLMIQVRQTRLECTNHAPYRWGIHGRVRRWSGTVGLLHFRGTFGNYRVWMGGSPVVCHAMGSLSMPWDLSACHGISQLWTSTSTSRSCLPCHGISQLWTSTSTSRVCHAMGSLSSGHPPLRLNLRHNADTLTKHVAPCLA
jgi:hypothetical protein